MLSHWAGNNVFLCFAPKCLPGHGGIIVPQEHLLLLLVLCCWRRKGKRYEWPGGLAAQAHEAVDDVDGDREDDGGVVLGGDAVQCLKIPQLKI